MRPLTMVSFLGLAGLCFCGCHSSSAVVSKHFAEMAETARAYPNDCEGMGEALLKYLDVHGVELQSALQDTGHATDQEANDVFRTSLELHEVTHGCMNASVEKFRLRLAEMTLSVTASEPG